MEEAGSAPEEAARNTRQFTNPSSRKPDQFSPDPRIEVEQDVRWPEAELLAVQETAADADGTSRRVKVLRDADSPFPIRVSETFNQQGEVVSREEMVANRYIVRPEPEEEEAFLKAVIESGGEARKISRIRKAFTKVINFSFILGVIFVF